MADEIVSEQDACCVEISIDTPWRQGDIFVSGDLSSIETSSIGMILTADCDIAQSKFGGALAYLPILPLGRYVTSEWALDKLASARASKLEEMQGYVNRRRKELDSAATPMTQEGIQRWFLRSAADEIGKILGIDDPKDLRKFSENHHALVVLLAPESPHSFNSPFDRLCAVREKVNKKNIKGVVDEVTRDLQSEMPMDLFFLPDLPRFDSVKGFLVSLRHVHAIESENLTSSLEAFRENSSRSIRVGRLIDRYKYAITQQFAQLYSRIAKVPGYERRQKEIVLEVCSAMAEASAR